MEYTFNFPTSWVTSQGPLPSLTASDQSQLSPLGANNLLPWAAVPVTGCSNEIKTCVKIYNAVRESRLPNYLGVKLPLPSGLLIPEWRRRLVDYHDESLCDYLAYGWPINYMSSVAPVATNINHSSALAYPRHVDQFLARECTEGAMLGPFPQPPFAPWSHTSPLLTREKQDSDARRVILDLSWPLGGSTNDGTPKETYMHEHYKLHLPTVDDVAALLLKHGRGCFFYTQDLARAYGQIRVDPLDWPLLGIHWKDSYYFYTGTPFGARWGSMFCQRMADAICYLAHLEGRDVIAYIDDYIGAASTELQANIDFVNTRQLFKAVGLVEAVPKELRPTQRGKYIGILFDTVAMNMKIPPKKLTEIRRLLQNWVNKRSATKHELQCILGKLHFVSRCCKPARLFVARMLDTLRAAHATHTVPLSTEFQKDINWFIYCMPSYNGVQYIPPPPHDAVLEVDACLTGVGGLAAPFCYQAMFPQYILDNEHSISHLEFLNIVVALKLWGEKFQDATLRIYCDNSAAISVLTTGKGLDPGLLSCAREAWLLSVKWNITLLPAHRAGVTMTVVDALSRAHTSTAHQARASALTVDYTHVPVSPHLFRLSESL